MQATQLQLPTKSNPWSLDRNTIKAGKAGLAQARAILATCKTVEDDLTNSNLDAGDLVQSAATARLGQLSIQHFLAA